MGTSDHTIMTFMIYIYIYKIRSLIKYSCLTYLTDSSHIKFLDSVVVNHPPIIRLISDRL